MMETGKIKIVIVEDEGILLRNIKKKILAVSEEFVIVGEAYDGREAWEAICREPPDIVFTDIRMPVMGGLELARRLHETYPEIYTVIVSGYDDFEYARTALEYRVSHYLLKPLQTEPLRELLAVLRQQILERRENRFRHILESCLRGTQSGTLSGEEAAALAGGAFSLYLVCRGNLRLHQRELPREETAALADAVGRVLGEDAPFSFSAGWSFAGKKGNLRLVLLEGAFMPPREIARRFKEALEQQCSGERYTLVFGRGKLSGEELDSEAAALYKALEATLVPGKTALTDAAKPPENLPAAVLPTAQMQQLQAVARSANGAGMEEMLLRMFAGWEEKQRPQQWIDRMLQQIMNGIQRARGLSEEMYGQMSEEVFSLFEDSGSLSGDASRMAGVLASWAVSGEDVSGEAGERIDEMEAYIRAHYTEDISLAWLADKYHFNQSYMTRVFKRQKGIAPLKLINTLRIHDAIELLCATDLSVREISESLGFSNQHYFSRIFKEFTSLTPKEYRNRERGG